MNTNNVGNPLENASRAIFDVLRINNNDSKIAYIHTFKMQFSSRFRPIEEPEKFHTKVDRLINGVIREGIKRGEIVKLGHNCYDFSVWYWRYQAKINSDMCDMVESELEPIFVDLMNKANNNAQEFYTMWLQIGFFSKTESEESEVKSDDIALNYIEATNGNDLVNTEVIGEPERNVRKKRRHDSSRSDENVQPETIENSY